MNILKTDVEVSADGSLKLLSPLPDWLRPGRTHMLLMVTSAAPGKRHIPTATPEMIAERLAAFEALRKLDPYRDISDAAAWQREIREDVVLPGRA